MHLKRSLAIAVALVASLAIGGVVLAAAGTLDIGAPWGPADQDTASAVPRVEVSYTIKANGNVPSEAVDAVEAGVQAWIAAINVREASDSNDWDFDIVPFSDATLPSGSSPGSPVFACHRGPDRPDGGGCGDNGGTTDDEPDIEIQLKKGGGLIAGSAQSSFDNDGFREHVKIQISGSAFGLASDADKVKLITMHELGHAFGLRHHSNDNDLMGPTVGGEDFISECDLDGFEESHHWLTGGPAATNDPVTSTPHVNHETSIACS